MMNQQEILKKIGPILEDLSNQHQYLIQSILPDDLEIKLFVAHADFLINHLDILKKLNAQKEESSLVKAVEISDPIVDELDVETDPQLLENEIVQEPKTTIFHFSLDEKPEEMVFDFEKELNVEEVFDRALSIEEMEILKSKTQLNSDFDIESDSEIQPDEEEEEMVQEPFLMIIEDPIVAEEENVAPITEEIESKKMTLNELLSSQLESRNSSSDILKKVSGDLKSAISLNDKMLFIKSLFNGYSLSYSEAIEILNRFDSFESADNFLIKNYAQKNNWQDKQEVVDRFYEYLNRKFVN